MKNIILIIMISQVVFGQNTTTLTVNLNGKSEMYEKKIYIENVGYEITDSIIGHGQNFDINISKKNNTCYRLVFDNRKTDLFFLEKESNYTIDINTDSELYTWYNKNKLESKITGGDYNEIFYSIKKTLYELEILKLQSDTKIEENLQEDSIYTCFSKVIREYPFIGLSLLYDSQELLRSVNPMSENIDKYMSLVESLDNNIKIHPLVKEVKNILDSLKRLTPGGAIYDFSLINSKKEYINTFDKRGQFLLVLFTINGCEYGKEMLEDLRKNYAELKKKKFDILEVNASINFEYNFKWIKNLEKIYNYPWEKVYLFDNKLGAKILRDYNMILFPRSFLYSRDGILIEVNPSSEKILMLLNKN